ncbi:Intraflagellar transport protein 20 [Nymphon striatum]|nr:Intraflagellar transport protein 20 [Nymphon striatum]
MAAEALSQSGLYFDDLNKIRVLEPEIAQQSIELKEEGEQFVGEITEFQKIIDGFISIADSLAKEVEEEKIKAIGSRNLLKSIEKQREAQEQQLLAMIFEKRIIFERLFVQSETLNKELSEQNELIEQFMLQR